MAELQLETSDTFDRETGLPGLVAHLPTTPSYTTLATPPIPGEVTTDRAERLKRRNQIKENTSRDRVEEADSTAIDNLDEKTERDNLNEKSQLDIMLEEVDELCSDRPSSTSSYRKADLFAISTPLRRRRLSLDFAPRLVSTGTQTETLTTETTTTTPTNPVSLPYTRAATEETPATAPRQLLPSRQLLTPQPLTPPFR